MPGRMRSNDMEKQTISVDIGGVFSACGFTCICWCQGFQFFNGEIYMTLRVHLRIMDTPNNPILVLKRETLAHKLIAGLDPVKIHVFHRRHFYLPEAFCFCCAARCFRLWVKI